ncbi:UNVERIFIED_ORG: hypothetical protein BDK47_10295 [Anoxybacillus amylolyticus]
MLSFSFYLFQSLEQIEETFQLAARLGAKQLFTSLHVSKGQELEEQRKLDRIGQFASCYGIGVVADVTPTVLSRLSADADIAAVLRRWGIVGLRLDDGFSMKEAASLSKQVKVVLNASTMTEWECKELVSYQADESNVEAWQNFYPRPETGLGGETIQAQNQLLRRYGIEAIGAFIPGDAKKRGPLYEGLPTLEAHRNADPVYAYIELTETYGVNKVFVGDLAVSDGVLKRIDWVRSDVIPIRYRPIVGAGWLSLVETVHTNRRDAARDVIRSVESRRSIAWPQEALQPLPPVPRRAGRITIDNERYGRYAGELQMTLVDLPPDDRVNVIGEVIEEDVSLLRFIHGGRRFCLIRW